MTAPGPEESGLILTPDGIMGVFAPPPDGRLSTLHITCPRDGYDLVAVETYDGESTSLRLNKSSRHWYIGYQPTEEERAHLAALPFLSIAVAAAPEGESGHWHYHLACDRPTCPFELDLHEDNFRQLQGLALRLWAAQEPEITEDVNSLLRRVSGI